MISTYRGQTMYPKISFSEPEYQNYFKNSDIYSSFYDMINQKLKVNEKPKVIQASIQLFMESVIKHNLDTMMLSLDFTNFVTEDNSKLVKDVFGSIVLYKSRHEKTDKDYDTLRTMGHITNNMALYCLMQLNHENNVCENIKAEFGDFVMAQKQQTTFKPKLVK